MNKNVKEDVVNDKLIEDKVSDLEENVNEDAKKEVR